MKHLFVPYELALKLKEKGFDEECLAWWHICNTPRLMEMYDSKHFFVIKTNWYSECPTINAPTYQQVVDWFREKHNLHVVIHVNQFGYGYMFAIVDCKKCISIKNLIGGPNQKWSYYDALTEAIEEALKLI